MIQHMLNTSSSYFQHDNPNTLASVWFTTFRGDNYKHIMRMYECRDIDCQSDESCFLFAFTFASSYLFGSHSASNMSHVLLCTCTIQLHHQKARMFSESIPTVTSVDNRHAVWVRLILIRIWNFVPFPIGLFKFALPIFGTSIKIYFLRWATHSTAFHQIKKSSIVSKLQKIHSKTFSLKFRSVFKIASLTELWKKSLKLFDDLPNLKHYPVRFIPSTS